ncbi:lipopolysaccharide assembly protein LapB [Suttonella sp. R2A3]|uniref:lipopolysaccharide assembly protein LapB n=1 Tax=Suttonella sp. R2A3 TaxID=2908648 RepID=UPI001F379E20|nr:lipopolysaccharide assembly protein LapB [Suttonella sp. R2A3]UJF25005.1 lipopolysaccharide assembly protein LapB [Suttonella sp. R2A3]
MAQWLVIFLLPLAAWSGWWVAMRKEARMLRQNRSRAAYFEGLSYLLNDQTDKAVDVFVNMSALDHQTIDNQLTLGSLFRKRGELDRALHLHQQLAEQTTEPRQKRNIQFELGEDYRAAGMFAQAQSIFEALFNDQSEQRVMAVLIDVYERTGNWQAAQDMAQLWQDSGYGDKSRALGQYDCELAIEARARGDKGAAQAYLQSALGRDHGCIRANMLLGECALDDARYLSAIHALQSTADLSPAHIPELLPSLRKAHLAINQKDAYRSWLKELASRYDKARLQTAIADELAALDQPYEARVVLEQAVAGQRNPLLVWSCLRHHVPLEDHSEEIISALKPQTIYQCHDCGFRQQRPCWHCPACFSWNSFQAVLELKMEQR